MNEIMMRSTQHSQIVYGVEPAFTHFNFMMAMQPTLLLATPSIGTGIGALHGISQDDRMIDGCIHPMATPLWSSLRFPRGNRF
jgi:hypothetical protein